LRQKESELYLKKMKKYEERARKFLEQKIQASSKIHNIIFNIKEDLREKVSEVFEDCDFSAPSIQNIPSVVRTGNRDGENVEIEPVYCLCRQKSHGDMIGCDSPDCKVGWFHFGCVGLTAAPRGNWLCPHCRKKKEIHKSQLSPGFSAPS
jgi:hypothetical protein